MSATLWLAACGGADSDQPVEIKKTPVDVRVARRSFDGAPPVIPHGRIGPFCLQCHGRGMAVPGIGYAPPMPHGDDLANGRARRCEQCHVAANVEFESLRESTFVPFRYPDVTIASPGVSPPVVPHALLLRENCMACHGGPAAHASLCRHEERRRCVQCHVAGVESGVFVR